MPLRFPPFRVLLSIAALLFPPLLGGQSAPSLGERPTQVDLPLLELPYNVARGVRAPGMSQSLAITSGVYSVTHTLMGRIAPKHPRLRNVGITLVDYFTIALPLHDAWLHEEWHRAVLGRRGIDSRNDVWNLKNIFAEAISVSHVSDESLVRFKRDTPRDFVRMKAAGYEAENELINRLEHEQFFRRTKGWHVGLYWLIALNDQLYVGAVTSPEDSAEIDDITDRGNLDERTVRERDVSGHDFTAWVYHLFRPDEPFEARGTHPTGVGLDRYIKVSDLTTEEKAFLRRQGQLAWLNFVDPNFLGVQAIRFRNPLNGGDARANAWLRHSLTSFGHTVDAHVVFQQGKIGVHGVAQRFTNGARSFPGLRVELVEYPLRLGAHELAISPRLSGWMQPRGQGFRTRASAAGGLLGVRLDTRGGSRANFFADVEVKSAGWVAGRPSLERGAIFSTGLRYTLLKGR